MTAMWRWATKDRTYGNYGNANQWTVNAGLTSLARESAQNTNDARLPDVPAELVYSFIRLTGKSRTDFLDALRWDSELRPHLTAMADAAGGAVTAGQLKTGVKSFDESDALILLRVADYGCTGLTGPEFQDVPPAEFGNFIKLCRLDLFSGKDAAAGGSFGLGKAVYWRFSKLQTVLFNSTLPAAQQLAGRSGNRLFGVNQGVVHDLGGKGYQGRGYFGLPDNKSDVSSIWGDSKLAEQLHLSRATDRPGTSALMLGFYDPDQPELGLKGAAELSSMAQELRSGVEENFWPLLARERLRVRIEVIDNGKQISSEVVNPEDTYTELVRAIRRFDRGELDSELDEPYSVVSRDIPIHISRRRTGDDHMPFVHNAKLVITVSDLDKDTLENRVCLFRKPEMVVQTIDRVFEGRTYHAFLLAGGAISPDGPTLEQTRADDFLRYAEPPAHDRWIPGSGRRQTSQANLTAHYVAPWVPNLKQIEASIQDALTDLFGAPPPTAEKAPESIFKHLKFLRGEHGTGGAGATAQSKPTVDIVKWKVVDGRWNLEIQIKARNRPEGWSVEPTLHFFGLDGNSTIVDWQSLEPVSGCSKQDGLILLAPTEKGRFLKATVRAISIAELPIPAEESAIDVLLRVHGPLPVELATAAPGTGIA